MNDCYENADYCSALQTDFYELTMAQGYFKTKKLGRAVFEMFFRRHPFGGGFSIFAGLESLLEKLRKFSFSTNDIDYLRSLSVFDEAFLEYLASFKFTGNLDAVDEGSVVFPQEPLIRVDGNIIECQIIETLLLNTINFQSLIATKTARIYLASEQGTLMEFGLRRAQGADGALSASRASFIGGAAGTSNVLAGKEFGIKVMGTMAHSWVMAFSSEEEAFRAYAALYPKHPVFLIDTYDTLKSGIVNAIAVGKEIVARGGNFGVRLDSGDIHYLSCIVRKRLDAAGCTNATIAVSNDLDETIIKALVDQNTPVDSWGVGTHMVTGGSEAAFTGVYKLVAHERDGELLPAIKFSDNPEKTTVPGIKQIWRLKDRDGMTIADVLADDDVHPEDMPHLGTQMMFWHPSADYRHFYAFVEAPPVPLLKRRITAGVVTGEHPSLSEIQAHCKADLTTFDASYKRLLNPHIYKVSITERLRELKLDLIKRYLSA
ncbi:MAG: nicotinate phosphoribosyltransferase [Spirochaetaceae bacterium]|jgi:nicotinate phosphoribosyltransferase|nr:nicotinate phosphoribosyltransferase [Spirochaetaceae bacterium]